MTHFMKRSAAVVIAAALLTGFTPVGNIAPIESAVTLNASAAEVEVSTWADLQAAINSASNGDTIVIKPNGYEILPAEGDTYLYVPKNKKITLDLNNKYLHRGLTTDDTTPAVQDGFVIKNDGDLTITNGQLSGGNNIGDGGGIYNNGTLTIVDDVYIDYNKCTGKGGGVYNANGASLYIKKYGSINGNTAALGGGVYNSQGASMYVIGCDLKDNRAENGGAIYNEGALDISSYVYENPNDQTIMNEISVDINGNYADDLGGAIYNKGTISVKGDVSIYANNNKVQTYNNYDNVYLADGTVINVTGKLGRIDEDYYYNSTIGVTLETPGVFTTGFAQNNPGITPSTFFTYDYEDYGVKASENGEAMSDRCYWSDLQSQIEEIVNSDDKTGTIKLKNDCINYHKSSNIIIPNDVTLVIDLNGHTIDLNRNDNNYSSYDWDGEQHESGCVIANHGNLTIKDSSGNNSGKITGGSAHTVYSYCGGGVYNADEATLTIEGGTITGNRGQTGGVTNQGTFYLKGGVITGNYAHYGAGISGDVIVSGSPVVKDNYSISSSWVYNETTGQDEYVMSTTESPLAGVILGGALTDGAELHMSSYTGIITENYAQYNGTQDPSKYFKFDNDDYYMVFTQKGEVLLRKDNYLKGASLALGSTVYVNFEIDDGDNLTADFEWANGSIKDEYIWGGDNTSCSLPIKELGDTINYTLRMGDEVIETGTYNAKTDYLEKLVTSSQYTAEQKQMAAAVANYAAAAQLLFDYNTDSLVNENIPYTPSASIAGIDELTSNFTKPEVGTFGEGGTMSYYGSSLLLESRLKVRHYFIVNGDDITKYAYWLNHKAGNVYYIDEDCYSPETLVEPQNISISYYDNNTYETITILKYQYGAMDYVYQALHSSKVSDNTKVVAKAVYYFANEAKLYTEASGNN